MILDALKSISKGLRKQSVSLADAVRRRLQPGSRYPIDSGGLKAIRADLARKAFKPSFTGAWLLSVAVLAGACAQVSGGVPDINRPFVNPDFAEWHERFERPGREVYDRRFQIVAATGVKADMAVADIGAGTGLFTRLFADKVGKAGRVYAVDISRVFIDNIVRISRELGQINVQGIVNSSTDAYLPPHSIDLAFICDTYHHFDHPRAMMESIRRALKPGGSVVIVDFRKVPGLTTPWVMGHVRANEELVVQEIEAAGFRLVEDRDFLRTNYFLRFVPSK